MAALGHHRRVFYCLTNYAIIRCRILWSAVRIATMEHKQIKKEARKSWKLSKGCRLSLIQFRSSVFYVTRSSAYWVHKRVCKKIAVHLSLLFIVSIWIFSYCTRNNLPVFSDVLRQMVATRKLYGNTATGNIAGSSG